jgi:hypothetical protein
MPQPAVVMLDAPDEVVRNRMLARYRIDDTFETIDRRLSDYHAERHCLIDWYTRENLLRVDATQTIHRVFQQINISRRSNTPPSTSDLVKSDTLGGSRFRLTLAKSFSAGMRD